MENDLKKMEAKELRIGNWIRHKYSEPDFIVSEINAFNGNNTVNGIELCDCEPIPLTEEWLTDLGFEKVGSFFEKDWLILHKNIKTGTATILKYVHELQNLYFALTGRELKLK